MPTRFRLRAVLVAGLGWAAAACSGGEPTADADAARAPRGGGGLPTGGAGAPSGGADGPTGAGASPSQGGSTPVGDTDATPPRPSDEIDAAVNCGDRASCIGACADLQTDPFNCGACGRTCVLANANAGCAAGECTLGACAAGFFNADGVADNGCEAESICMQGLVCASACGSEGTVDCAGPQPACAPPDELCNSADDDCDGACDEGPVVGCRVAVHRGEGNGHIFTTDLNQAQSPPYRLEAAGFFHLYAEPFGGMRPVFLCLKGNGKRFLSSDSACEIGVAPERTLGFWGGAPECGAIALYRLYSEAAGNHFYTISAPERDNAIATYGYRDEGIAGWVWPGP